MTKFAKYGLHFSSLCFCAGILMILQTTMVALINPSEIADFLDPLLWPIAGAFSIAFIIPASIILSHRNTATRMAMQKPKRFQLETREGYINKTYRYYPN